MLDFADRAAFRDVCRASLDQHASTERVRARLGDPDDMWSLAVELGWVGLLLDQSVGGAGVELIDACVLIEEIGAHLVSSAVTSHLLATWVATRLGAPTSLLEAMATGELRATMALEEPGVGVLAPDGVNADVYVIATSGAHGDVVMLLERAHVQIEPVAMLDLTRSFATVTTPASADVGRRLGAQMPAAAAMARALGAWGVTCDAMGAARTAVQLTAAHVRNRHQFGGPLGQLQAVKQRAADMHLAQISTRFSVEHAAKALDLDPVDGLRAASAAAAVGKDACATVAAGTVQLHGGMGFTWENDAHLLLRRIKLDQMLFGVASVHARLVSALRTAELTDVESAGRAAQV